ncbi:MFS general substrate transporter [Apiospora kogelbergensis]|uniref:MFS general substrate transporter n=1 Tax=Apiospora kogelbergensis TaxID=1337665 RepID=UPI00313293DC
MSSTATDPKPAHGEAEMVPGNVPRNSSENTKDPHEPQEESIDPENEVKGVKLLIIHLSICLCTFLVGLDFSLIATAIPVITSEFNSVQDIGWYGAAFQLALCSTQPLAGKTYILWSKKYCYLLWLGVFEVGSLVCALAPTSTALIVGRAVAGLGASGVFAGGFALLTTIIPLHKRAIYTGTMSSVFSIANIVGPPMGGAFTQNITWRWCFYVNLPIGGFAAVLFFLLGLDGLGFSLFAGSMIMFLLALQWGGVTYPWKSSIVIGLFVGFGVTLMLFIPWQMYMKDDALIPPRLFTTHRNVALICAGSFFINGPFQLVIYWLPVWFQAVMAATPVNSGTYYLPTVISDVLASFIGSGLVMQLGWWNPFLMLSEAFVCIGGGLLSTLYPGITSGHWIGYQIFGGIGYALSTNLAHLGMQASLPKELVPIGASNLLMFISTSCSVFLAVGQTLFQQRLIINLSTVVDADVVTKVISAGATNYRSAVEPSALPSVIEQYSKSITQVFYIPAAAPSIAFFLVSGCAWISIKKKKTPTVKTDNREGSEKTSV